MPRLQVQQTVLPLYCTAVLLAIVSVGDDRQWLKSSSTSRFDAAPGLGLSKSFTSEVSSSGPLNSSDGTERTRPPSASSIQPCPSWGTAEDQIYCQLWRESVQSIPYYVPWNSANRHLLKDSIIQHCEVTGTEARRLCCDEDEWSCLRFKPTRQRFHDALLTSLGLRLRSQSKFAQRSTPVLAVVGGVPGTGKTSVLKPLASALINLHHVGNSQPSWADVKREMAKVATEDNFEWNRSSTRAISADDLKVHLAEGKVKMADGEVIQSEDALCERVQRAVAQTRVPLPLVHSQYLHRESVYLADLIFKDTVSQRQDIILEKSMTSFDQVKPYISHVLGSKDQTETQPRKCDGCDGLSGDAPDDVSYRVIILAAVTDWDHCKMSNTYRRGNGHKISTEQLQVQHQRYNDTVSALITNAGRQRNHSDYHDQGDSTGAAELWVVDTNAVIEKLASNSPMDLALDQAAILLRSSVRINH